MPAYKRKLSRSNATAGSYKRRRLSVAQKASAALSMARRINSNIEVKGFGVSRTGAVTSTVDVKHLSAIPQGDGNGSRTGDHIVAKRIRMKAILASNNAGSFQQMVRIVIVHNMRQQAGTDAVMTNQFSSGDLYGFNFAAQGFHNQYVHYDKVHAVPRGNETASGVFQTGYKFVDINIPLPRGVKVTFNEATGADIDRNGFYIYAVSQNSTNAPALVYEAFLDFTDP